MDGITMRRRLTDEERLDWLRLTRADQVGPVTFFRLLDRFGSAGAAFAELPRAMPAGWETRISRRPTALKSVVLGMSWSVCVALSGWSLIQHIKSVIHCSILNKS